MKIRFVHLLLLASFAASAQATYRIGQPEIPQVEIKKDAADFRVYPGHPRLFFRDTDLPAIRERIRGDFASDWKEMTAELDRKAFARPPADFAQGGYLKEWSIGRNVTFVAAVTGEARYVKWAKDWSAALAAAGPVGTDPEYRGRLQCLAIAYDWLFPVLDQGERDVLAKAIFAHLDRAWHFAAQANFIGNHSRWGNFTLAAGLLALVTEHPELHEKLLQVRSLWVDGYFPAQGWIAEEGGYHMGWAYSGAYLTGSIHYAWSTATNECVFFPWQAKLPWFWIYGRQGDGMYPNRGDAYTVTNDLNGHHSDLLMIGAGVLKDSRAAWAMKDGFDRFPVILYGDKHVKRLAPDAPEDPLPLSRIFRHAGVAIARDRWDDRTTLLQFSSAPFYSTNHLHRDANSFTLHYRGHLAIDSGVYDETAGPNRGGYGGVHWRNYFTRTIAHNAIVVFDPAQKMTVLGEPVSNDGGQVFRRDPVTLQDIQPGGFAALDGITRFVTTDHYTYASGDATKAYDPARVSLAQREIVYLRAKSREHPVVVVFDRVESTRPEFEKHFLLHTVEQPVVRGKITVTENNGGRLSCVTLLPQDAKLELIGGPGKEAWVDGKNYPWNPDTKLRSREPGAWRLEVSPGAARRQDYFLHVLFVDDVGAVPVNADDAQLSQTSTEATVRVAGWEMTFPFKPGAAARIAPAR
jgi:hypothetical protein